MSSDMMIICKEDNSNYKGDTSKAFFIDECSMGMPWSEFGEWFQDRYCGHPSLIERMAGMKEHFYIKLTKADYEGIRVALETMKKHENLDNDKLLEYIEHHIGKHISTENW